MLKQIRLKPIGMFDALPRDTRDTLFLLLVIAWILLPQAANLPLWCSGLTLAVLAWRGFLAWTGRKLPNRWWLVALLAITIGSTLISHQTLLGRDAGVTLLVVLLTLKTLEMRARRDAFVIFFLGFLCLLSNFFYLQSLFTAFNMLLGLLGLLTALVNAHMPVGRPPLMAAARQASWMTLLGMPIMLVLFLLFPRLAPLWGEPNASMSGRSGLSASMEVGNIASLALDNSVAMQIRFENGQMPSRQDLYFRGPVLTDFDGRQWQPSPLDQAVLFNTRANLSVFGAPVNYEITLEPTNQPWLFVMEAAKRPPMLDSMQARMRSDLQWLVERPITEKIQYKAQSFPNFQHGPATLERSLGAALVMPAGFNPRTIALAKNIRNDPRYRAAGSAELVNLVMNKLRTEGYRYTLEPGLYGVNSADEFWFDRKLGFCEHIASAFVLLMRALDIPARIVTGYQGGEQNSTDGSLTVRQSDAHAWAEVWQQDRGWVRVDPTSAVAPNRTDTSQRLAAPENLAARTVNSFGASLLLRLKANWGMIDSRWNQWVLNYTQSNQLNLLKNLGFKSPGWAELGYLLMAIVVVASSVASAWMLFYRSPQDAWLKLLAKANQKLRPKDIRNHPQTKSPRQLAETLNAQHDADNPSIKAIRDWLLELERQRYASASSASTPLQKKHQLQTLALAFNQLHWPASAPSATPKS